LNLNLNKKTVSQFTLYHILKKKGITNWLVKKRPALTLKVTAKHLQFVKDHEYWDSHKWKIFLWSNKYSIEQGSSKQQQWVFCTPAQKWNKEMIQSYNKDKNKLVMIWACFEDDDWKSDLVFMPGDSDSKRGEVTSAVYLKVIKEQISTL